ncbi:hypothetical protein V5799_014560, partial [Amblyomma americanum]
YVPNGIRFVWGLKSQRREKDEKEVCHGVPTRLRQKRKIMRTVSSEHIRTRVAVLAVPTQHVQPEGRLCLLPALPAGRLRRDAVPP